MIARIGWLLARPGAAGRAPLVLPVVAFGIVTALLLTVLGGAQSFFAWTDDRAATYQGLAVVALVLLVVPLLTLCGAAARLSARRRDDRLSTLRLLGVPPGSVTGLAVAESTVLALLGSLAGVVGYLALAPLVGLLSFRGRPLGLHGVLLDWRAVLLVVLGVTLLAAVSTVVGLRRVVISPLGVRVRDEPPRMGWGRPVVALVVVAVCTAAMLALQVAGAVVVILAMVGGAFGGAFAVLNLLGPWLVRRVARRQLREARTADRLLAARTVLESPKAAWRQVSGVAMTSFTAVFGGCCAAVASLTGSSTDPETVTLTEDLVTGLLVTLVGSFLMVAATVSINQAAEILDRAELTTSLGRLGVPLTTVDAARRRAVMTPLLWVALSSALTAAVVVLPLTGVALMTRPLSLAVIAASIAAGLLVVRGGLSATRPMLARTLTG